MTYDYTTHSEIAAFTWAVADLLRGDFRHSQYGRVILPFTLLRRLECALEPVKEKVLETDRQNQDKPDAVRQELLLRATGQQFFNTSPLTLSSLSGAKTAEELMRYIKSFSQDAREIFEHFRFEDVVQQLSASNLLYQVVQRFASIDLSPEKISNFDMGVIFEELIRKFAEGSNEAAGEHFTPKDIIHLITSLVFTNQEEKLKPNNNITLYDPAAGTGGFLSEGNRYIHESSEKITVSLYGQEINPESYAICKAGMLIKGQNVSQIKFGDILPNDQLESMKFDFMLSNPPFGMDWKKVQKEVVIEQKEKGFDGRFGPGLPRVSDGSLLFLMHMVSKMRDARDGGSRIGIVLTGSSLFSGSAGTGESEIRRYLLENDLVDAIVALPTGVFYNTGIATYVWMLSNNKQAERKGKVQLIDATDRHSKVRKSLGSKRQYVSEADQDEILRMYGALEETEESKLFSVQDFGYRRITVERPLKLNFQTSEVRIKRMTEQKAFEKLDATTRDQIISACHSIDSDKLYQSRDEFSQVLKTALDNQNVKLSTAQRKVVLSSLSERDSSAAICTDKKGEPEPDVDLRYFERVSLSDSVHEYFEHDIKSVLPDSWIKEEDADPIDGKLGIVGYDINFKSYFMKAKVENLLKESQFPLKNIGSFSTLKNDDVSPLCQPSCPDGDFA